MYTLSYHFGKPVRKIEVQFAMLDDAYMAAVAVDNAGAININVSNTAVHDILAMRKKYNPAELCKVDCLIRKLAKEHCRYGASMPLVIGKARGISEVLRMCYDIDASVGYVWDVLSEMYNEPQE